MRRDRAAGRWARTRGESEHTFWLIQQDFVLKYPDAATLEGLNETWTAWMAWHNWHHSHKGLDQASPADRYIPSPEDPGLLLIHEESRKVLRTGNITYYGQ